MKNLTAEKASLIVLWCAFGVFLLASIPHLAYFFASMEPLGSPGEPAWWFWWAVSFGLAAAFDLTDVLRNPKMTSYLSQHHDTYLAKFQTKPRAALSGAIAIDGDANYTGKACPMYSLTDNQSRSGNLMQAFTEHSLHYLINPKSSSPGSVFEHATSSLLLYGTLCGATYELAHRRASFGSCLTGDTLIHSIHQIHGKPDGTRKRRLDDLYARTLTSHGRSRLKLFRLRSLDETTGTFAAGKIKQIICSGMQPVFSVKLADGKTITTTKTHRFLTKNGWMTLEDAVGGLEVTANGITVYGKTDAELMVNGRPIYQDEAWLREQYITKGLSQASTAELAGASPHTIRAWIGKHHLQAIIDGVAVSPATGSLSDAALTPCVQPSMPAITIAAASVGSLAAD